MERFFRSLKTEWMPECGDENFNEASTAITNYITRYYNQLRLYQYNDGLTPNKSEQLFWKNSEAVAIFLTIYGRPGVTSTGSIRFATIYPASLVG